MDQDDFNVDDEEDELTEHEIAANFLKTIQPLLRKGLGSFMWTHKDNPVAADIAEVLNRQLASVQITITTFPSVTITGLCVPMEHGAFQPKRLFTIVLGSQEFDIAIDQNPHRLN